MCPPGPTLPPRTGLVAGFVITGAAARTVLIRGLGPGMADFGVRTALADPQLELFSGPKSLAANDHWPEAPRSAACPVPPATP